MRFVLLALALLALTSSARAQPPDWGTAPDIEVRLSSFAFAPERIELVSGQPYRLHLVNTASGGHNFDAARFFAAARIHPSDRALVKKGVVEVKAGETRDIRLIAPAPGSYKLHCSHFLHTSFGMTGLIVVR